MDERLTGCSLRSSSSSAACRHQWACEGQKHLYIGAFYSCGVLLGVRGRTGGGTRSPGCVASRGHHHCCVRLWNKDESIHCTDTLSIEHAHIGMWHMWTYTCICVSLVQEFAGLKQMLWFYFLLGCCGRGFHIIFNHRSFPILVNLPFRERSRKEKNGKNERIKWIKINFVDLF